MKEDLEYTQVDDWNFVSIINYIKDNMFQFILLFFVFVIIYVVDHISNINAGIIATSMTLQPLPQIQKQKKHKKFKK
jgi:hypothetical protein